MDVALVILDGWGIGPTDDPAHRNAVAAADTSTMDAIAQSGAFGRLSVSGRDVGLPDGQMGNSEVGHLNIGAGRIVYQEYTRINDAIAASGLSIIETPPPDDPPDPAFDDNPVLIDAFEHAQETGGRVHFLGLVSDGGVHSDFQHLMALIELAAEAGVPASTHAFTDGRDTAPTSGADYLHELEPVIENHGTGHVATVSGRYYAMDRDQNWERTARAYDAIVNREAEFEAPTARTAIETAYERGTTDEFIEPTCIEGQPGVDDGDVVIFFNFRADRARQLTRMLASIRPQAWSDSRSTDPLSIHLVTMTEYDATFDLPVAFKKLQPEQPIGAVIADAARTQLRIAESEKYAHVTYFLNGGREVEFPGERREIVPSPDVATYDLAPEMSAEAVTDTAVEIIASDDPDALVLNYANPDMVGHTGEFEAAVTAVETVDTQLARLLDAIQTAGGHALVTADHGNAEDMGSETDPHTAHTTNDVPFVYLDPAGTAGGTTIREGGILADIAPTMLTLMEIDQPAEMTGTTLLLD